MSPDRCATLSLHTVGNCAAAHDSAVQLLYTCTLSGNLGKPSGRDELSVVPQVVLFGEKRSHCSRCSSREQMLIVATVNAEVTLERR